VCVIGEIWVTSLVQWKTVQCAHELNRGIYVCIIIAYAVPELYLYRTDTIISWSYSDCIYAMICSVRFWPCFCANCWIKTMPSQSQEMLLLLECRQWELVYRRDLQRVFSITVSNSFLQTTVRIDCCQSFDVLNCCYCWQYIILVEVSRISFCQGQYSCTFRCIYIRHAHHDHYHHRHRQWMSEARPNGLYFHPSYPLGDFTFWLNLS